VVQVCYGSTRKKLIGAARHWLCGGRGSVEETEVVQKLRAMGVPEEQIERRYATRTEYEIWPENKFALQVFDRIGPTQWSVVGRADGAMVYIGLRYECLPMIFDLLDVPPTERADCLWGVQVMERTIMHALNNRAPS
jgi:hypothetical protein